MASDRIRLEVTFFVAVQSFEVNSVIPGSFVLTVYDWNVLKSGIKYSSKSYRFILFDCSLYLGLSDLDVETVFRTTDGFVAPWTNWFSPNPQGNAGQAEGTEDCGGRIHEGTEDCGGRIHDRQQLGDYGCHHNMMYYCEGDPNK